MIPLSKNNLTHLLSMSPEEIAQYLIDHGSTPEDAEKIAEKLTTTLDPNCFDSVYGRSVDETMIPMKKEKHYSNKGDYGTTSPVIPWKNLKGK